MNTGGPGGPVHVGFSLERREKRDLSLDLPRATAQGI